MVKLIQNWLISKLFNNNNSKYKILINQLFIAPAYGHSQVVAHSPQVEVGHAPGKNNYLIQNK